MNVITWTDEYSVGNEVIDGQHKQLLEILNHLIGTSKDSKFTIHSEAVSKGIKMLTYYARDHFITEELIFSKTDYPRIDEHKKHHYEFEEYIAKFKYSLVTGKAPRPEELLTYVSNWINNHILIEDMEFKPYLS